jgi:hypothetical protein
MKTAPVTNWKTTTMSGKTAPRSIPHPLAVRDRSGSEVHRYNADTCTEEPDGSLTVVKDGQPVAVAMRQAEILATALRRIVGCSGAAEESERIGRQALREAGL